MCIKLIFKVGSAKRANRRRGYDSVGDNAAFFHSVHFAGSKSPKDCSENAGYLFYMKTKMVLSAAAKFQRGWQKKLACLFASKAIRLIDFALKLIPPTLWALLSDSGELVNLHRATGRIFVNKRQSTSSLLPQGSVCVCVAILPADFHIKAAKTAAISCFTERICVCY
jgi:hypothetical protein